MLERADYFILYAYSAYLLHYCTCLLANLPEDNASIRPKAAASVITRIGHF